MSQSAPNMQVDERTLSPIALSMLGGAGSAYGVLSWLQKDNLYGFGARGFLYTTPWVVTERTVRYQATLLLTASGKPFVLSVGGRTRGLRAAVLAPLTPRGLCARNVGQITVHIGLRHPCFAAFRRVSGFGALELPRAAFACFDEDLVRAYEGRLEPHEARRLFENLIAETLDQLPAAGPSDPRCDLARALVRDDPEIRLSTIAERLEVSYTKASEIVSDALGLPLRAYQHGCKCDRAARRLVSDVPLTRLAQEAGFSDSAHFTKSWQRRFGHPPSYTRDRRHVRVVV